VGPVAVALALLPFRRSVGLAAVLFCTMLVVVAVAALGGVLRALIGVVFGYLAGTFFFAPPYNRLRPNLTGDAIALIAFVVVGVAVGVLIDGFARMADEQAELRRVATLAARGASPTELFAAVSQAVGQLLSVDFARLGRFDGAGTVTAVGGWNRSGSDVRLDVPTPLGGQNVSTYVADTGHSARMDSYVDASGAVAAEAPELGFRSAIGTPIIVEDRLWGVMIVASAAEKPLPRSTEARLADVTALVATAIGNGESRAQLAASRARIVTAADESRRRIERDLHDGTQQRLISLGLELRALETAVPPGLTDVRALLSDASKTLSDVVDGLHEIARGIHPAILSKGGLGPAIKTVARRSPVPIELDLRSDWRLPEQVEVAAYYVVSEALTNAAKHAQASVVHVDLSADNGVLRLSIRDDGVGGADPSHGSGLIGLTDRVETLNGRIEITSPAGAGTSLLVTIPIDDTRAAPPWQQGLVGVARTHLVGPAGIEPATKGL
jgi:signal transduction histidine kinase